MATQPLLGKVSSCQNLPFPSFWASSLQWPFASIGIYLVAIELRHLPRLVFALQVLLVVLLAPTVATEILPVKDQQEAAEMSQKNEDVAGICAILNRLFIPPKIILYPRERG